VRLNELVVWNTSGVVSANGEYVDWIELYNENDHALDISGWTLTDDDTDTDKYMLPAGTVIGPQSYLLVYASTDNAPPTGELHTGFALDEVNGGYLGLFAPIGGTPTLMSEVEYPAAEEPDRSYSLLDDEEELKFGPFWGPGVETIAGENLHKKVWWFEVYATTSLVYTDEISDPMKNILQHSDGDPSSFVTILQWLQAVRAYTAVVLRDDRNGTIQSPITNLPPENTPAELTIQEDTLAIAEVDYNNITSVIPVSNLPSNLVNPEQVFRTAQTVDDRALVLVNNITIPGPGGDPLIVFGLTIHTTTKHVILVAPETRNSTLLYKWHPVTFVHELGHYSGMRGHPMFKDEAPLIQDSLVISEETNSVTGIFEHWFQLSISHNSHAQPRQFYEGVLWGSPERRSREPNRARGFTIKNPSTPFFLDEAVDAVQPW